MNKFVSVEYYLHFRENKLNILKEMNKIKEL